MKKHVLVALILAASSSIALAQNTKPDSGSLSDKVMEDLPGTKGGSTSMPTAKTDEGSLSDKVMKDAPGTMGGSTSMPVSKVDKGTLTDKAMKDHPGTQ
jgi:hypothetical protein